jgi:hypothetical protein
MRGTSEAHPGTASWITKPGIGASKIFGVVHSKASGIFLGVYMQAFPVVDAAVQELRVSLTYLHQARYHVMHCIHRMYRLYAP